MINLRCLYCQTPFTVGRAEMLTALITMDDKNQNHYDAHCPRCRRANSISRQRMELFFPNWREAAKQLPAVPADDVPASTSLKTEPLSKSIKTAPAKKASSAAKASAAKPAAKKPVAAKKPASAKKTTPAKKTTTSSSKTSKTTKPSKKK